MPLASFRLLMLAAVMLPTAFAHAGDGTVTVFAAISLKEPLDKIGVEYTAKTGTKVVISYGASGALAKQIENGAPADIFASADVKWMDYLAEKKLIDPASRMNLLGNRLVLVSPADAGNGVTLDSGAGLSAALGGGRLAMGNPASVPAGEYAEAALRKLGLWDAVSARLAMTENVRGALAFVARGEAPLGIVYQTDALSEPRVKIVATFPPDSHPPIVYPCALVTGSTDPAAASVLAFLRSPVAASVFQSYGFVRTSN